jgi:hypothetical protein
VRYLHVASHHRRIVGFCLGCAHHGRMTDSASTPSTSGGHGSEQAPESYLWPLTALVLVILPQVLVPASVREGPPLLVPVIEGCVALVLPRSAVDGHMSGFGRVLCLVNGLRSG